MNQYNPRQNSWQAMRWIISFIKVYRGWFLASVLATGALIAINLTKAYFLQAMINHALQGGASQLIRLVIIYMVIIMGGTLLSYLRKRMIGQFSLNAMRDLKNQLATHLSRLTLRSMGEVQSGDLASRMNNDTNVISNFVQNDLPKTTVQIVMAVVAAIYVACINWKLLVVSFFLTPVLMYLASYLNTHAGKYYPESYKYLGAASAEVEQSLIGMEMIKTYNLKDFFAGKLQGQYEKVYTAEMNAQKYVAILQPVCFSLSYIPRLICALYGGQLVVKGEMGIGSVIAILQLFEYVVEPTVYLPFVMNRIHRAIAAIERVSEVFSMQEERMDGRLKPVCTGEEELPKREGEAILRLENVAFGYDPERRVLSDVNFELKQGKLTALVGASGGGKSTIINLLTGLYECDAGRIELCGVDLRQLTLPAIREQIAVVSQDTYLFPATIAENIRYGRLDATMEEVIAAARAVYVDEFVENLPAGYQTMVGEGGSNLSGGQRQRIAMARAVLKNAPILLLDEPTASLDHHTETLIQQSLERLMVGRTVLVIAHRLSTIIRADQILVLDNGQIVEAGTHETLLGQRGLYERLTNMQSSVQEGRAC